jgi:hypothetical protein
VQEQQPLVARDGGEGERGEAASRTVGLLGDGAPVRGADDPDGRVARVTVLGVGDRQQRLVVGEGADAGVLGVCVHDLCGRVGRLVRSQMRVPSSVEVPTATSRRPISRPAG